MVIDVPPARRLRPGYVVTYPNRDKPASRATKLIVVVILLVSIALMLTVTIGGWSKLQGLTPINFAWCIAYGLIAFYVWRWARGLLPIAAALGVLLLTFSLLASTTADGISWSDRGRPGYAPIHSLFGGGGLSPHTLAVLTFLIAPVQLLLVVFAMQAFAQAWNVEFEVPGDQPRGRGANGAPATA
jgi:hypothetical protein